jgi:hypothetical protein
VAQKWCIDFLLKAVLGTIADVHSSIDTEKPLENALAQATFVSKASCIPKSMFRHHSNSNVVQDQSSFAQIVFFPFSRIRV